MELENNKIVLTKDINGNVSEQKNQIVYDEYTYILKYLSPAYKSLKGGNSSVFIIYDKNGDIEDRIVKICNFYRPNRYAPENIKRRYTRFIREIEVLERLKEEGVNNVINIYFNGVVVINGNEYPYYVMEKGDTDLKDYLLSNHEIDNYEKVRFCFKIFEAVKELHRRGIYHRDIKPDNVFFFSSGEDGEKNIWKIGDLGLISDRHNDYDDLGEKIGPFGWISPEVMNKYLTERAGLGFDCNIDDKSDIFQLGKLFWFIFQCNVPIGQIELMDFICKIEHKDEIFKMLQTMLQYAKNRRLDIITLEPQLIELKKAFSL